MEKYDINYLIMNLYVTNTNKEINGYVTHQGYFKNETDSILLELDPDFIIDSIYVNSLKTNYFRKKQTILIPNYKKDFNVSIYYHGSIKNVFGSFMNGSGVVNGTHEKTKNKVTYTLSEPFSASEWWPSKQSLNDKIDSADLYFTTDNPNLVGSNGILISKNQINNNLTQFHWKTRYPTTYYLFSFSVGPYLDYSFKTFIPEIKDSILVQNFIYSDSAFFKGNKNNIDLTSDYIKLYSNLFGIYPFHKEKYGHCLSTIAGGMEHQTMTTLNSFDPALVSHELAHQWFGNHVTCSSFKDIWLNEGFATYSEYLMFEKLFPDKKNNLLESYTQRAKSQTTGSVFVKDTLDENRIFSRKLSYDKGALILHTLRYIINNDALFFNGIKNYQNKFGHSFANVNDFKEIMEKSCDIDLTAFFNEWYYGEGYPIYSVKTERSDSTRIFIDQTTTSANTSLFTTPIELLIHRENQSDTLIRISISKNNVILTYPNSANFSYIKSIDPNNFLLNETTPYLNPNELISEHVKIFPNPTHSKLIILTKQPNDYLIKISDLQGKEILKFNHNSISNINIENINPGLYSIEITSKNLFHTQKLIIE
jgi:aminopeptidase N